MDSKSASLLGPSLTQRARLALALAALALLAACSALRIGYNNADAMLAWSLDGYLDLNAEQAAMVRASGARLLAWHRETQLREYSQLLAEARAELGRPVSVGEVLEFQSRLRLKLAAIGEQAAPDMAELALTLRPAQIERLQRKLAEDNAKARRELTGTGGDPQLKQAIERAEDWFGPLSREQKAGMAQLHAGLPLEAGVWLDERERRQRELLEVLLRIQRDRPSQAEATRWLRGVFAGWMNPPEPARAALSLRWRDHNAAVIAWLINHASRAQREHLAHKLASYQEDVSLLAAEASARRSG
ncbi:MAG: DUF6279 family lipoprotein [Burkholderiaceae bacterium]